MWLYVLNSPLLLSELVVLSYLVLYTAYSKVNKQLELQLLVEIFKGSKTEGKYTGWTHSFREFNKLISLAGLTLLILAFVPGMREPASLKTLWYAKIIIDG
jgi:hypothetical protein